MERAAEEAYQEAKRRKRAREILEAQQAEAALSQATWDEHYEYVNAETHKPYTPHSEAEREWVESDAPTYAIALGGEGGGKSVAGIVKDLKRLQRGMSGAMVSPDFEHFKKSLWKEFRRWCPWQFVVESQRHRQSPEWVPTGPFDLVFNTQYGYATLTCGGIKEPGSWEGPNLSFAHFDEARHAPDAGALKVLSGRVRIVGPHGEPPQLYITTTSRKNWLFDYFGDPVEDDPYASFKANSRVIHLPTAGNLTNLSAGYVESRGQTLTEAEKRVFLLGEWEDIDEGQRYLESILWWDGCQEQLPALGKREGLVIAMDAGISNDSFGMVATSRHPARHADVAVRFAQEWVPPKGHKLDFNGEGGPIPTFKRLCDEYSVLCCVYDNYQLHSEATRLASEGIAWMQEFSQGADRLTADKELLDLIIGKRVAHDGHAGLRRHIDNADRKLDGDGRRLRIVKRSEAKKIDLAVCLSMAGYQCLKLNI